MKKLINLKGAVILDKTQQKEVNGGINPVGCSSDCSFGRRGRCYFGGHCGCPGVCLRGFCQPL